MKKKKKGVTNCVPNEKRRQDEKDHWFPGGTSLTFKEPFGGSCTSVLLSTKLLLGHKQQTLSQSRSLLQQQPAVFHMARAFEFSRPEINPSRCQPLCGGVCRVRPLKEIHVVQSVCCYANVGLNQCEPQGLSVTCCMSSLLTTSISHDRVPHNSGTTTGPHF